MTPSIDRDLFRPMDREFDENGTVTLGFVGHVTRPKGAFEIPNMLAHLVANGVDARVEYAGPVDSDGEELRSALASAEVEQRVDFLGRMSNAQIAQRMRGWRLMLAPSYGEGYGRAILEAFVTRVPVAVVAGVVPAELECRPGVGAATRIDYPQLVLKMLRDPRRPPPGDWIPGHDRGAIAWDQLIDALPPEPSQNQPPPLLAMRLRRIRRLRPLQRAEYHAKRRVRQLLTHSHPHACG